MIRTESRLACDDFAGGFTTVELLPKFSISIFYTNVKCKPQPHLDFEFSSETIEREVKKEK